MKRKLIIVFLALLFIIIWSLYIVRILHLRKNVDTDIEQVTRLSGPPLTLWMSSREMGSAEGALTLQLINEWNRKHSEARVILRIFHPSIFEDTLTKSIDNGVQPDIIIVHGDIIERLKKMKSFTSRIFDIDKVFFADGELPELPGPTQKLLDISGRIIFYPIAYGYRRFGYVSGWYFPRDKLDFIKTIIDDPFTGAQFVDLWRYIKTLSPEKNTQFVLCLLKDALPEFFTIGMQRMESVEQTPIRSRLRLLHYITEVNPLVKIVEDPDSARIYLREGKALIAATCSPTFSDIITVEGLTEQQTLDQDKISVPIWFPVSRKGNPPTPFLRALGVFRQDDDNSGDRTITALEVSSYLADPLLFGLLHFKAHCDLPLYPAILQESFGDITAALDSAQTFYSMKYIRFNRLFFSKPEEPSEDKIDRKTISKVLNDYLEGRIELDDAALLLGEEPVQAVKDSIGTVNAIDDSTESN